MPSKTAEGCGPSLSHRTPGRSDETQLRGGECVWQAESKSDGLPYFSRNRAVEAELIEQGEGYVWLYRDMAKSSGLEGRLERMLWMENIDEESSEEDDDDYIILRTAI